MTTVGILSDTHGNRKMMLRAAGQMKEQGCTLFFHLGDTYRDSRDLMAAGIPVIAVPGNWDPEFTMNQIPNARLNTIENITFALVHDPLKLTSSIRAEADVLLTGHSHGPFVHKKDGKIWLNPGHLKSLKDKGYPPGFAIVIIDGSTVACRLCGIGGETNEEKKYVICSG